MKIKVKTKISDYQKAADAFIKGATQGKYKGYKIINNYLVHDKVVESSMHCSDKDSLLKVTTLNSTKVLTLLNRDDVENALNNDRAVHAEYLHIVREVIAKRQDDGTIIVNSSQLKYLGSKSHFGYTRNVRGATPIQQYFIDKKFMAVPFVAFEQAKLSLDKLVIVERGKEETVKEKYTEYNKKTKRYNTKYRPRHFTGATLFRIEDSTFLFDLDRREVIHGIINPFIVELPFEFKPVTTIKEAYDALIPNEVKDALKKGKQVKRQGEWFFIPTTEEGQPDKNPRTWQDIEFKQMELRVNNNRPNIASQCIESKQLVRGEIKHTGREHEPLNLGLDTWFKPVPNTASKSFTITGDVD